MKHIALILALTLSACGTTVKVNPVDTQTVDVPVAQPCPKAVDPLVPPLFPANDAAMKNLPYPKASAALKAAKVGTVDYDVAKGQVDANAYYLLQLMAADRLVTRSWIDKLSSNLKVCQSND